MVSRFVFVFVAVVGLLFYGSLGVSQRPGGGPDAPDQEIVKDFDVDGDGVLNTEERAKARASLKSNGRGQRRFGGRGPGGPGGPGGRGRARPEGSVGPRVKLDDVEHDHSSELYEGSVLRTLFLEFEGKDWEQELADFKPTDVEVPATLTVDGKVYPNVGVSFRGASSFFMVPAGSKRSLNLSMDLVDGKQRLNGYKTLNLLNCNGDATLMSSYLYSHIAGQKIATPKVNFLKVVINGRSWGVYANAQQFNKDFVKENFGTKKGARWKVSGSPRGDAGLRYLGDEIAPYRSRYDLKSKEDEQAWKDLIHLCKVLNETPAADLETALESILDIDGVLWFLATDVALINSDGYWTRASDYSIYQDKQGMFHILPHDMNEAFRASHGGPGGPGGGRRGILDFLNGPPRGEGPLPGEGPPQQGRARQGGPPQQQAGGRQGRPPQQQADDRRGRQRGGQGGRRGNSEGGGYELEPLTGLNDRFPLRSKLLANETLRTRYLQYVKIIARDLISWDHLGPIIGEARELIKAEVKADTRKLMSNDDFLRATDNRPTANAGSLQEFCEKRSEYLLGLEEIKQLPEELIKLRSDSKSPDDSSKNTSDE